MHEASLAYGILDTVCRQSAEKGFEKILEIRLRIGQGAGVQADSLRFAFDIAKEGTRAAAAELVIEQVPLGGYCKDCGKRFTVGERYLLECPACCSPALAVTEGFEMDIVDMEVE